MNSVICDTATFVTHIALLTTPLRPRPTTYDTPRTRTCCRQGQARKKQATARVDAVRKDKAAIKIQGQARKKQASARVQGVREGKAASKIQAQQRGKEVREHAAKGDLKEWRGEKAAKEAAKEAAATKIQVGRM